MTELELTVYKHFTLHKSLHGEESYDSSSVYKDIVKELTAFNPSEVKETLRNIEEQYDNRR